jgi:hypothetical protein
MADVEIVRGTLNGATVETSVENAARLGAAFVPEGVGSPEPETKPSRPAPIKRAAAKK